MVGCNKPFEAANRIRPSHHRPAHTLVRFVILEKAGHVYSIRVAVARTVLIERVTRGVQGLSRE